MTSLANTTFDDLDIIGSIELPPDQRHELHLFRTALAETTRFDVMDPDQIYVSPEESSSGKPINLVIAKKVLSRTVRKEQIAWISPEFKHLTLCGLDSVDPLRSARAETSAHGVFFGVMYNSDDTDKHIPVAIKPFKERRDKAVLDWLSALMVIESGMQTFSPVGYILGSERGYSITKLQKDADTFENTNWHNVLLDPEHVDSTEQLALITQAAEVLAEAHDNANPNANDKKKKRIIHGDLQFKNIASNVEGDVFFVDWERADIFNQEGNEDRLISRASRDLLVIFSSMARTREDFGVGLLSIFNPKAQWHYFSKYFMVPYTNARLGDTEDSEKMEVLDEIESRVKEYILQGRIKDSLKRTRNR